MQVNARSVPISLIRSVRSPRVVDGAGQAGPRQPPSRCVALDEVDVPDAAPVVRKPGRLRPASGPLGVLDPVAVVAPERVAPRRSRPEPFRPIVATTLSRCVAGLARQQKTRQRPLIIGALVHSHLCTSTADCACTVRTALLAGHRGERGSGGVERASPCSPAGGQKGILSQMLYQHRKSEKLHPFL